MEIPRPSRTCSVSRREFLPGETVFSVVTGESEHFERKDIAAEHWEGPPEEFYGWWKWSVQLPIVRGNSVTPVSKESLLNLFDQLTMQPDNAELLYVLTLLLIRRKLLRYERETEEVPGSKMLEVYSFQTGQCHQIPVAMPNREQLEIIQQQIAGGIGH